MLEKYKVQMCHSIKEEDLDKYKGKFKAEPKFDGARCLYIKGKFYTIDRKSSSPSRDISYKLPEMEHTKQDVVLDGEILALGGFENTGSRIHMEDKLGIRIGSKKFPVTYYIFDILEVKGNDVRGLPLLQRKELLKSLKFDNDRFHIVEYTEDIDSLWAETKAWDKEGIVLKDENSVYEGRRSYGWLKCKNWSEAVVIVDSYTENPKGIRASIKGSLQGIQISGGQSHEVKQLMDKKGEIEIEVQYLSEEIRIVNGKEQPIKRFPSFKRVYEGF